MIHKEVESDAPCRTSVITLEADKRLLSPRNSRRLQKLVDCRPFTSLRAVQVTAPPCPDRQTVDWRGPQTQQRDFCISLLLRVYGKPKWLEDFVDRERIDRVTPSVCGRHGRSVSPPALRALCPAKDWLVDGLSRTSFFPFLARASLVFSSRPQGLWASMRHPDWKGFGQHFDLTQWQV